MATFFEVVGLVDGGLVDGGRAEGQTTSGL